MAFGSQATVFDRIFTRAGPAEVVDKEREKLAEQAALHAKLVASLSWVG